MGSTRVAPGHVPFVWVGAEAKLGRTFVPSCSLFLLA